MSQSRTSDQRGSVAIETVIGVPALGMFVALIIMAGRVEMASQSVEAAAFEAARSASIERTYGEAVTAGEAAALRSLREQDLKCTTLDVHVDAGQFNRPTGTAGEVTVTVRCRVGLSDLALPGGVSGRRIVATASSPIDTYRARRG